MVGASSSSRPVRMQSKSADPAVKKQWRGLDPLPFVFADRDGVSGRWAMRSHHPSWPGRRSSACSANRQRSVRSKEGPAARRQGRSRGQASRSQCAALVRHRALSAARQAAVQKIGPTNDSPPRLSTPHCRLQLSSAGRARCDRRNVSPALGMRLPTGWRAEIDGFNKAITGGSRADATATRRRTVRQAVRQGGGWPAPGGARSFMSLAGHARGAAVAAHERAVNLKQTEDLRLSQRRTRCKQ